MRVKIGNTWYDSDEQPICIQVSEHEQKQIADMDRSVATQGKYAIFPTSCGMDNDEKRAWMEHPHDT